MARVVRKNLMVDAEALRTLAQKRGVSESQAVRDAVEHDLALHGMASALEELSDTGFFDHLAELYGQWDGEEDQGLEAEAGASGA